MDIKEQRNKDVITAAANTIMLLNEIVRGVTLGKREDLIELDFLNAKDTFARLSKLFPVTASPEANALPVGCRYPSCFCGEKCQYT